MALTNKRKIFIEEYLNCWNATEAARRSGYKHPNKLGPRLLTVPEIDNLIGQRLSELEITDKEQIPITPYRVKRRKCAFVYLIQAENGLVKIGKTVDVDRRFRGLNALSPVPLRLLAFIGTEFADEMEDELHARFEHLRIRGEWFQLSEADILQVCSEWEGSQGNAGHGLRNICSVGMQLRLPDA